MQRRLRFLGLLAALTFGLNLTAACGESGTVIKPTPIETETAPPSAPGATRIELGDLYFKPDVIRLEEGQQVQIELANEGAIMHEFMVGRQVEMHDGAAEGYEHDFFEGVEVQFSGEKAEMQREEGHGTEVELEAGGKAVLSFTVPAGSKGEWEIGCFVPGHYEGGMKGALLIE